MLAIALSALVLIIFQTFFAPETPVADNESTQQEQTAQADNDAQPAEKHPAVEGSKPLKFNEATEPVKPQSTIEVKTADLLLTFNETSGNILNAEIQQYNDKPIEIIFGNGIVDYMRAGIPVSTAYKGKKIETGDKTVLTFTAQQKDTLVTKRYEIEKNSYLIKASVDITNSGDKSIEYPVDVQIGPGLGKGIEDSRYIFQGPMLFDGKKIRKEKADDVDEPEVYSTPEWLGYTSKYFLFAALGDFADGKLLKSGNSAVIKGSQRVIVNPDSRQSFEYDLYIGPKKYGVLKEIGSNLEKSINYGFFSFLAIPMLKLLNFVYDYVSNYGVAIIILTMIIKLITFPLTQKSMVSMKKMQKLQPKMQELKEKYKDDKQKMNAAVMDLYKQEGANPFGGCLPIIVQIPVFFALYRTLLLSIELKGSPFIFHLTDLSLKDPYYITPILMGVTMFLQQRMSPQTGDPMQQKVFMLMPVIFTFLFLQFPSGLVIYWLTNNVLSIAQQYFINKKLD